MGFKIPKSIDLLILLTHLKWILTWSLARLGLIHSTPQENESEEMSNTMNNYVLIQWPANSVVPVAVPIHIVTSAIKRSVPVIEYRAKKGEEEEDEECSVCLSCIEGKDEIRELSNCDHVFHKECLDNWVDVGQVTCPLCRSMLFPPNRGDINGQNPCFFY